MIEQEKQSNARRSILKRLAGTGAVVSASALLPGQWVKPVVNTVVMPGHAQTSALNRLPAFFTSPGFSRFVVPADVNTIQVDMSGGGGGAGGGVGFTGGAGGEGERVVTSLSVSPGETLAIEVGAGGDGGLGGKAGGKGGGGGRATSVNSDIASGGGGGGGEGPGALATPGQPGEGPNGGKGGEAIFIGPTAIAQGNDGGSGDGAEGGRGSKAGDGSDGEHGYVLLS